MLLIGDRNEMRVRLPANRETLGSSLGLKERIVPQVRVRLIRRPRKSANASPPVSLAVPKGLQQPI